MTSFQNVIDGVEHFPKHLYDWITNQDSLLAQLVAGPLNELVAYEQEHGKDQVEAIAKAGVAGFNVARTAGSSVGDSIKAGVAAAFEVAVDDVKLLSTQAMTFLISGAAQSA